MNKVRLYFTRFLGALCLVLLCTGLTVSFGAAVPTGIAHSLPQIPRNINGALAAKPFSRQDLAQTVLENIGIAQQYDMYFDHVIGLVVASDNSKFKSGLRKMLAQEAGWSRVRADYGARLLANFSTAELQELLRLSKRPLLQRLLRSEIQAYNDTSPKRFKLLNEVWTNYNEGKINVPQ
jgi:hypothetical protein